MAINVTCRCGKSYVVFDNYAGKSYHCLACGTNTIVPAPGAPSNAAGPNPGPAVTPRPVRTAPAPQVTAPSSTYPRATPAAPRATPAAPRATPAAPAAPPYEPSYSPDRRTPSVGLIAAGGIGAGVIIACGVFITWQFLARPRAPVAAQSPISSPAEVADSTPSRNSATTPSGIPPAPTRATTPARSPKDAEQIFEENAPSVAFIDGKTSSGSGILVAPNLVATNAHVIRMEFARNLEVHFPSAGTDDKGPFHAEVIHEDAKRDLAFLSVRTRLSPLKVAEAFEFHPGMSITIIGSPGVGGGNLKNAISIGVLSSKDRRMDQDFYQLSASINPGNSGGPVFNKFGEVIGVATLKASRQEAIAWCIPVDDLRSGISRVRSQPQEVANDVGTRHRLQVISRLLTLFSTELAKGMDGYVEGMVNSLKKKEEPTVGLNKVASVIDPRLSRIETNLTALGLKDEIGELSNNRSTDREAREQLFNIWETIQKMKAHLDHPHGTVKEYADEASRLKEVLKRQTETVQLRLGIPADDD